MSAGTLFSDPVPRSPGPPARPHAFAGTILMAAQSRLLPYHLPLRFFVAAAAFQVVAWGFLAVGFDRVSGFTGGTGVVLAGLHALTLGVLAMTVMGASFQLLGVAAGVAMRSYLPCRLVSWLFIPGTAVLVGGMAGHNPGLMAVGGAAVGAGFVVYAYAIAGILRRASTLKVAVRHVWGALAGLGFLTISGWVLIADFGHGVLGLLTGPDHGDIALFHAVVAVFGFMGLLAFGFSYVLVPMFALSAPPSERHAGRAYGLIGAGIGLTAAGAIGGNLAVVAVGAGLGFVGAFWHIGLMIHALRTGMKKRLGLSFMLIRAAWAMLLAGVVLGGMGAASSSERLATLAGFVVTFGWLLTFLTGVLQRILPFLASMHAHNLRQRAPRMSELGERGWPLKLHAIGHGLALVLVAGGIAGANAALILGGAAAGVAGALAYLWFSLDIARRLWAMHALAAAHPPSPHS